MGDFPCYRIRDSDGSGPRQAIGGPRPVGANVEVAGPA